MSPLQIYHPGRLDEDYEYTDQFPRNDEALVDADAEFEDLKEEDVEEDEYADQKGKGVDYEPPYVYMDE